MKLALSLRAAAACALTLCLSTAAFKAWTAEPADPSPSIAKDARLYEMRTYYAAPGKLEALHARFRDHTNRLFQKHGMTLVGYWVPADKEKGSDNTLVYILAFPSREARQKAFQAFGADPEWTRARAASEVNGRLVEKVESVLLNPTDYSPIK
jgi:hypothetical protein